jgi:ABC-type transporter Mla subunit MlaD
MADRITTHDHTRAIQAIFENSREIMRNLRPTPAQVLQAALAVNAIDASTKRVLRQTLAALPGLEQAQQHVPPRLRERLTDLEHALVSTQTVEQTCAVLEGAHHREVTSDEEAAWNKGIEVALAILEDGKETIYSPAFVDDTLRQQGSTRAITTASPVKTIGGADAAGAVGGAVGAFVTGAAIPAIPVAALFGGVAASLGAGIAVLLS